MCKVSNFFQFSAFSACVMMHIGSGTLGWSLNLACVRTCITWQNWAHIPGQENDSAWTWHVSTILFPAAGPQHGGHGQPHGGDWVLPLGILWNQGAPGCSGLPVLADLPGGTGGEPSHHHPGHHGPVSPHPHVLLPKELVPPWCLPCLSHCPKLHSELLVPQKHHLFPRVCLRGPVGNSICWSWAFHPYSHVLWPLCSHLLPSALWYHHEQGV